MNWGYKIILVYVIFVLGISFLVYRSSIQNEDLVTENYYEKELKYQDKIDTEKRTAGLSRQVSFERRGGRFVIHFPKEFAGKKVTGDVALYCPSDEKKDQKQNFELTDANEPVIFQAGSNGMNILQVSWQSEGLTYYFEQKVVI